MIRVALLLLSLLWTSFALAQKCSVSGIVIDDVTGEPIRAGVVLSGVRADTSPESAAVQTQGDGRFRFDGLEPGRYSLVAHKGGFFALGGKGALPQFELSAGDQKAGVTIRLTPQGIISGRVLDETGAPVQGAGIAVLQRRKGAGKVRWQTVGGGMTNDRGEYRILDLAAGEYVVSASYRDPLTLVPSSAQPRVQAYSTMYFPNSLDANSAKPLAVKSGNDVGGIDLRLRRQVVYRVRVRVEGVSGEMLRLTNVSIVARDSGGWSSPAVLGTRVTVDGLYELNGVPAGSWFVQARTHQPAGEALIGTTPIEITKADIADIVVRVGAAPRLIGTLRLEGAQAAAINWTDFDVRLFTAEGVSASFGLPTVTPDGAFAARYHKPGKYLLAVQGARPAGVYLASIKVGGTEYLGKELDLTGGPPGPAEVIFRNDGASVSGRLEGIIGGVVGSIGMAVLLPAEIQLRRIEFITSVPIRRDGSFAVNSVRPGEYLVCFLRGDSRSLEEEGQPPKESLERAVRLKVEPNGTHTVTLKH